MITIAATAAATAIFVGSQPASALSIAALTLSPSSGPSTTSITATYRYRPLDRKANGRCGTEPVTFSWDRHQLAEQAQPTAAGGYCVATATFSPPCGLDSPGRHVVVGTQGGDNAQATFTITGSGTPTPTPAPVPPVPSAGPAPTASASPAGARPSQSATARTANPSASASESTDPLPGAVPGATTGPGVVGATMKPPSGVSAGTVIAVIVGALTVAGAGALLTLVLRKRSDVDADELPDDQVAAEA